MLLKGKTKNTKDTNHVNKTNIAPSEVTDNVGEEREDAFRGIPKLSCLDIPLIFPWGCLGKPQA